MDNNLKNTEKENIIELMKSFDFSKLFNIEVIFEDSNEDKDIEADISLTTIKQEKPISVEDTKDTTIEDNPKDHVENETFQSVGSVEEFEKSKNLSDDSATIQPKQVIDIDRITNKTVQSAILSEETDHENSTKRKLNEETMCVSKIEKVPSIENDDKIKENLLYRHATATAPTTTYEDTYTFVENLLKLKPEKPYRTYKTDYQLKILQAHLVINNSPSDEAIAKMANQSGLATKEIKQWFRKMIYKERPRNKDSPYNFDNSSSSTLNLEEYEKTVEGKVTLLDSSASSDEGKAPPEKKAKTEDISINQEVKSEPHDGPTIEEIYNSYDDRHQEDKSFVFPQAPSQSPAPIINNSELQQNMPRPQSPTHKSLNSLIQYQLDSISATSIPKSPHPSMLPPKINPNFTSPISAPPNVLPLTPNRSLSLGRGPACFRLSGSNSNGSNRSGSSRKGIKRTSFTDFQIKVLQEFFKNDAYPKRDDVEYLSKLLGESPKLIFYWFRNVRQKARKIYENQPAAEPPAGATDGATDYANRFQRTSGLNYQCKKCQLRCQRYCDLIRHQKTLCFKEEDAKRSAQAQAAAAHVAATLLLELESSLGDSNSSTVEHHTPHVPTSPAPPRTPTPATANYPVSPALQTPLTPVTPLTSHTNQETTRTEIFNVLNAI